MDFVIPNLGDGVDKADVARVLVKAGDVLAVDQPVLELETDKATVEVPSTVAGTITAGGSSAQANAVALSWPPEKRTSALSTITHRSYTGSLPEIIPRADFRDRGQTGFDFNVLGMDVHGRDRRDRQVIVHLVDAVIALLIDRLAHELQQWPQSQLDAQRSSNVVIQFLKVLHHK